MSPNCFNFQNPECLCQLKCNNTSLDHPKWQQIMCWPNIDTCGKGTSDDLKIGKIEIILSRGDSLSFSFSHSHEAFLWRRLFHEEAQFPGTASARTPRERERERKRGRQILAPNSNENFYFMSENHEKKLNRRENIIMTFLNCCCCWFDGSGFWKTRPLQGWSQNDSTTQPKRMAPKFKIS